MLFTTTFCFSFPLICCFGIIHISIGCRYPIYGGMQDWNYIHAGCFELTLEISDNKWPNANEVRCLFKLKML
uniref:Peptidase M14 domain-containing protein n=1 Tax=Rhizophora mucronata TaxID=61149 RepID=A0A2P2M969_RHIMU